MRTALLASVLAGLSTGIGGLLVCIVPKINRRWYDTLLGFSAGVMLATASISLLGPALHKDGLVQVALGLTFGALIVHLLERAVPHLEPHFAPELKGHEKRLGVLLAAALTIHHIPEGLAIGVAFAGGGTSIGTLVAASIAIQNIPEGLAVAMPLRSAGLPRWKAFLGATASGLGEPVAALFGAWFVSVVGPIVPFALAMAAGAMIFVASDQLIPESRQQPEAKSPSLGLMLGFVCVTILSRVV
jgi:zinc transporter, ZIP family